ATAELLAAPVGQRRAPVALHQLREDLALELDGELLRLRVVGSGVLVLVPDLEMRRPGAVGGVRAPASERARVREGATRRSNVLRLEPGASRRGGDIARRPPAADVMRIDVRECA